MYSAGLTQLYTVYYGLYPVRYDVFTVNYMLREADNVHIWLAVPYHGHQLSILCHNVLIATIQEIAKFQQIEFVCNVTRHIHYDELYVLHYLYILSLHYLRMRGTLYLLQQR